MTKVVLIGAGSTSFGPQMIGDLALHARALGPIDLWLVDTNETALDLMGRYASRVLAGRGAINLFATTNRCEALTDADFVIVSVSVDRIATWKQDWQIPLRHGVRHVLGENGGPGGLSHTLRSIGAMLPIARDVQALAPNALLLNFTNPLSRVCMAISRATQVRAVGLCHQIGEGYRLVQKVLGRVAAPPQPRKGTAAYAVWKREFQPQLEARYHVSAAGINHFTFITGLMDRATGENLLPEFERRLPAMPADFEPMSRRLHGAFGLFCATGDGHAGEYVGFAADTLELKGYDFDAYDAQAAAQATQLARVADGAEQPDIFDSGERAMPIIRAMINRDAGDELSVNVPNRGYIPNLPDGAIVEVPGRVERGDVVGVPQPPLPRGIASMLRTQLEIQELVVEGALTGRRKPLLQALLLDPTIRSYMQAEHLLDDLLHAHAQYLSGFA